MFAIVLLLSSCPPSMRRALTLLVCVSRSVPRAEVDLLIANGNCAEGASRRPRSDYFFFGAAFFEAFNGSSVPAPANPRRSLGGAFAFETRTYPSRGPGTAPSTISRLSSSINAANAQVANRDLIRAHVARHALAREHARRERRGADRTLHLEHVTVRLGTAAEADGAERRPQNRGPSRCRSHQQTSSR